MGFSDEDLTMETNDTHHEEAAPQGDEGQDDGGTPARRTAVGGRVEHFTVAERTARGKATRAEVSRRSHGDWEPAAHRPDPVELLEEQAKSPCARARADSLRPHARLAVHVLPWCGVPDGVRSRERAAHLAPHAALRRRAPLELRWLRRARSQARLQPQRLRRDAPRPVRVGRQAARCELRRRRP